MLASKRISLRLLEEGDLESRVKWLNDPAIYQLLLSDFPVSLARTRAWFASNILDTSKVHFSIVDVASGDLIGMTGFLQLSAKHQSAQMYITIGEAEYRGRGYAKDVIDTLLTYGFSELGLEKVYLWTLPENEHARNTYIKYGFTQEALMRSHIYCRGQRQDLYQHGILRKEFQARQL